MPPAAASLPEQSVVAEEDNKKNNLKRPSNSSEEAFQKSIDEIKNTIDKLQAEMTVINEKINNADRSSASLKKDELREKQSEIRKKRTQTRELLKNMNDSFQRKKRELRMNKDKSQYKTTKEVDNQIIKLEKQIESGSLKIIEEKRIVAEISQLKKLKKTVESFDIQQFIIDEEQKAIDELRKTLDDDEIDMKKYNSEFDQLKNELDEINVLYDEKKRIRELIANEIENRREIINARNQFRQQQDEERRRRWEAQKEKKEQYEAQKRADIAARIREDASIPAFQNEIYTCDALINYFQTFQGNGKANEQTPAATSAFSTNIRELDTSSNMPEGMILTKKADRNDDYFIGKKNSSKKKTPKDKKSTSFNLDIDILQQLTTVKVSIPINVADIGKTIEDLIARKDYYLENQLKVTNENIEKAEAEISALENRSIRGQDYRERSRNKQSNKSTITQSEVASTTSTVVTTTLEVVETVETTSTNNEMVSEEILDNASSSAVASQVKEETQ
ncbi:7371_t:CDS:2 [Ambispora gerdemannii]|uniref:7371_t:CDS:1 n=1 Tax=Ambispora gerdemannii TaxID=144530 RepID=A0A9N8YMS0_9GLOM|nr:7371_t:CDS:2 [Ambispora gerdemannii]